jgi:glycosyltransferase involved in cell wall biosynthesis
MAKKILFLLGSANISGGTYVILQHAYHMQKLGYKVVIALVFMKMQDFLVIKNSTPCWHPAINELEFIHVDEAKEYDFDVAIFTWWATLFSFEKINAASHIYFIQSIESRFYENHETFMRKLVNNTYMIGLPCITEAGWIQNVLKSTYHNYCDLVRNGMIKILYTDTGDAYAQKSNDQLRILVEGPLNVAFKNVKRTIELCLRANVGEIWLLTSSNVNCVPGVSRVFSQVAITDVPKIYRSCDVIVKLSYVEGMFGPPLEMFHCGGTAIVYDVSGFDEYIEHDVNALVVKTNDEEMVIHYLHRLNEDRNLLLRLITGAKHTAKKWINWVQSSTLFANTIEKISANTLLQDQATLIRENINKYLRERLPVVIVTQQQKINKEVEAIPLYDSGYYVLTLPVSLGTTKISILFGKVYKQVMISRINLCDTDDKVTAQLSINCMHMKQISSDTFESQTESGMLVFNVNLLTTEASVLSCARLQVEFHPTAIWENQSELTGEYA